RSSCPPAAGRPHVRERCSGPLIASPRRRYRRATDERVGVRERKWTSAASPGAIVLAALATLSACGGSGRARPAPVHLSSLTSLRGGVPNHVAVIVMENKEYDEVIGSRSDPFINGLARAMHWLEVCTRRHIPRCPTIWRSRAARRS